jgi:hypothetical protein
LSLRNSITAAFFVLAISAASEARAEQTPLFLFGGPDRDRFLGCLNCRPSEVFSIWSEDGDYGSPSAADCIWNRNGAYGSPGSDYSPWSRTSTSPPFVVDRAGNFYGYFTRNLDFHDNVLEKRSRWQSHGELERQIYEFLAWFLEDYDLIIANLDEVRSNR